MKSANLWRVDAQIARDVAKGLLYLARLGTNSQAWCSLVITAWGAAGATRPNQVSTSKPG